MTIRINHQQWTVVFGILGNIISILVYLAPVPTFYRIYKKKSTESFQSLPYQIALFSCMLWLYYALLRQNALLLVTINAFGCIIETVYITMYVAYAPKDKRIAATKLFVATNVVAFPSVILLTRFLLNNVKSRNEVLGWICVAVSVGVFAAPLNILARVIRTRSVEFMPFTLSFFLTISAIMWFAYGLLLRDICVALPNMVGFFLGTLQMIMYGIYRNSENVKATDDEKQTEQMKTIVVLSQLGSSEGYKIESVGSNRKDEEKPEKDEKADENPQDRA